MNGDVVKFHRFNDWTYWYNRKLRIWEATRPGETLIWNAFHKEELLWQISHADYDGYQDKITRQRHLYENINK